MALGHDLHTRGSTREFRPRLLVTMWLVGAAILVLVSRLYALQILRGEELTSKGRRNFVQQINVPHDRGIIYDRYGRILVDNRPSLDLQVTPAFLGKRANARETLKHLAKLLNLSDEELGEVVENVEARTGLERFRPVTVRRDLDPEEVEAIEGERSVFKLDGVDIVEGRRRTYHYGSLAAHLLGFVNEIDAVALDAERVKGNPDHYDLGDAIGREGIERTYEKELRGVDGTEKVVVDAKGRRQNSAYVDLLLGDQRRVEPTPGHNVFLTIDLDLQQRAEEAFDGRSGSIVAMDPRTGGILVLASLPAYDSNLVSGALAKAEKSRLDSDPLKPWLNRSIQGQYAPGSTFKAITALAALHQHATTGHEHIACPGFYKMGRHVWRCWKDSGHGMVDMHDALKLSCDTYFYTVGGRIGINAIAEIARLFGLGTRTGIPLRGELPGVVPDEAFHNRVDASTGGYQRGMAINTSIGQGSLLVTPLQLANAYAAIANGKAVYQPQLVDRIESADFRVTRRYLPQAKLLNEGALDPDGVPLLLSRNSSVLNPPIQSEVRGEGPKILNNLEPKAMSQLDVPDEAMATLHDGLTAVAAEAGGTAYSRRSHRVTMAGKTGTAQVVRIGRERTLMKDMEYFERDHAWFVGYAPVENPEIVIVVLNEHGGHGGSASAPAAVSVIDYYFELKEMRLARAASAQLEHAE